MHSFHRNLNPRIYGFLLQQFLRQLWKKERIRCFFSWQVIINTWEIVCMAMTKISFSMYECLLSIKLKYRLICTTSFVYVYTTPTTATLCADLKQSANIPPFKPEFPLQNIHLCTFSSFKKHSKNLFDFVLKCIELFWHLLYIKKYLPYFIPIKK